VSDVFDDLVDRQASPDVVARITAVAAERSVKTCAIYVRFFGNSPHSLGAREIAKRSDKSGIIGRERVIEVICNRLRIAAVFSGVESRGFRHRSTPSQSSDPRIIDKLHGALILISVAN
jgi:hypothetical protein